MAITTIKNAVPVREPLTYPKLMTNNTGRVYLMTGPTTGTLLYQEGPRKAKLPTGHHTTAWTFDPDNPLVDFTGKLVLYNKEDIKEFPEGGEV